MSKLSRCMVLGLAIVLLASGAGSATSLSGAVHETWANAWVVLEGVFGGPALLKLDSDRGCEIDPNGKPVCSPAPKRGCAIDPSGKPVCLPPPTLKHGCAIDPSGKPVCTP
jgi:hypothetical protein